MIAVVSVLLGFGSVGGSGSLVTGGTGPFFACFNSFFNRSISSLTLLFLKQ